MTLADTIARNRQTVERFFHGTHSNDLADLSVIDDTVSPEIVCHGFPGMTIRDKESYKSFFRIFRQSFTDMDWKVHALVADERYVSARWQIWVTHSGEFAGVKPDGRRITVDGMVLYRIEDGLIRETWLHINELMLLEQIGALPGAAQAAQ